MTTVTAPRTYRANVLGGLGLILGGALWLVRVFNPASPTLRATGVQLVIGMLVLAAGVILAVGMSGEPGIVGTLRWRRVVLLVFTAQPLVSGVAMAAAGRVGSSHLHAVGLAFSALYAIFAAAAVAAAVAVVRAEVLPAAASWVLFALVLCCAAVWVLDSLNLAAGPPVVVPFATVRLAWALGFTVLVVPLSLVVAGLLLLVQPLTRPRP